MTRGIALGGGAGLLWGLAFVLPSLVPQWSAVSVTTGRYLAYGVASLLVLALIARRQPGMLGMLRRHWRPAVTFAATGNVVYYLLLVVGIQGTGAPVASAIVGRCRWSWRWRPTCASRSTPGAPSRYPC